MTARLAGRDLGSAMQEIQQRLPLEVRVPPGTDIEYGGLYGIQRESFVTLTQVLLMSILLALRATGQTLNISSFMGAITVRLRSFSTEER